MMLHMFAFLTACHSYLTVCALHLQANPSLIDVNVLMSCQHLVEDCNIHKAQEGGHAGGHKSTLLQHVYHYILFEFSLWSKTQFAVRIGTDLLLLI